MFKAEKMVRVWRLATYLFVSADLVKEIFVIADFFENVQTFSLLTFVPSDSDVLPAEKQSM